MLCAICCVRDDDTVCGRAYCFWHGFLDVPDATTKAQVAFWQHRCEGL